MINDVIPLFILVLCATAGVVLLDVIFLSLVRCGRLSKNSVVASLSLAFFMFLGLVAVLVFVNRSVPRLVQASTILLYFTGCLLYMEMRSILSRGYSFRILIDLKRFGERAEIATLKSEYGGMGIRGLVLKRVRTAVDFGLVRFDGTRVGPLTTMGRALATVGLYLRALLRLQHVG